MQRLMHRGLIDHIPKARAYGQKIINDMDDWYWGLAQSNQAFHVNHPKNNPNENIQHYKSLIGKSDIVIVSTPYLMDRLSQFVKCPMILLPNFVDTKRFTPFEHMDTSPPTVGWVGSTGHRSGDLETISGILAPMANSGEIKLYHGGNAVQSPSFASVIKVDPALVRTKPMAPAEEYPSLMDMDIGVIPLSMIPFNEAKSDIKGLEYASAGIPFVAQGTQAYKKLRDDLDIGLVANKPTEWIRHIKRLFQYSYRVELAEKGLENVKARDIQFGLDLFVEILNGVYHS